MLSKTQIPKKIHYCWFGKGPKNKLFFKCFDSWKKYFPDYEIIEWNEENFDVYSNQYMKEAYENKKWAFVSDYARLKILYEQGGIYFDTDVEVLKKFDDLFVEKGYFAKETDVMINTGLGFGVYPKDKIVKSMLEDYENIHFINDDGTMDLTPCPVRNTKSLLNRGYVIEPGINNIEGIEIYPIEYFCGFDINTQRYIVSNKTYTVHHYNASWLKKDERFKRKVKQMISKIIGPTFYKKVGKFIHKKKN